MPTAPNKRIVRTTYGAFVALVSVFVGSVTLQVVRQLFLDDAADARLSGACAEGVRALSAGIDRAIAAGLASGEGASADIDAAMKRYRTARDEAWARREAVAAACAGDRNGPGAMAALARLERHAEGAVRRQSIDLGPVRREVDSFISSPR